jgi:hypothetical protein
MVLVLLIAIPKTWHCYQKYKFFFKVLFSVLPSSWRTSNTNHNLHYLFTLSPVEGNTEHQTGFFSKN